MAAGSEDVYRPSASDWVVEIDDQVKNMDADRIKQQRKQSIYRVPACIKDLNSKAYKPQVVSFGPYHHGEPGVAEMEEHKHRALLHLLKRSEKPLKEFVAAMEKVVQPLQDAYESLEERWREKDLFLQLMILDGCFMLEIMRVAYGTHGEPSGYASDDPVFSSHGKLYTVPYVKRDMLIIENQLPLLVLETLLSVEGRTPKEDANKFVVKFCAPWPLPPATGLGLHPLDALRHSLLRTPPGMNDSCPPQKGSGDIILTAEELYESGVRFRKSKTRSLRDIRFQHGLLSGVLSLPQIVVDDVTEYMFLNLMAFERLHVGAGNGITSYVFFMDNIIENGKDVALLHKKGIVENALGSDKAVAKLFNGLSKDVVLDPEGCLGEVHRRVNEYSHSSWHKWRANLIHTYFRSPWSLISLAAAIFLLVLTIMQTIYSALQVEQNQK